MGHKNNSETILVPLILILCLGITITSAYAVCGHDSPKIKWVPSINGHVPYGALRGGHTETGETMYIARAYHEKANTPGKLAPSHGCCHISFAGVEIRKTHCEVLVIEDNLC